MALFESWWHSREIAVCSSVFSPCLYGWPARRSRMGNWPRCEYAAGPVILTEMARPPVWSLDILAAEDTPSDIELLQMALARCGDVHSLQIVNDGREVIAYLKGEPPFNQPAQQPPNIVLMDLKMPRMTGLEVLRWMRNNPNCAVIPVIIMSNSQMEGDILEAYRLGVNAYFEKPSNFADLEKILVSILTFWSHAKRPPINKFPC
jgi:CheY-like chemotaxis protein